jgi:hypothetical protein
MLQDSFLYNGLRVRTLPRRLSAVSTAIEERSRIDDTPNGNLSQGTDLTLTSEIYCGKSQHAPIIGIRLILARACIVFAMPLIPVRRPFGVLVCAPFVATCRTSNAGFTSAADITISHYRNATDMYCCDYDQRPYYLHFFVFSRAHVLLALCSIASMLRHTCCEDLTQIDKTQAGHWSILGHRSS